ncbi:MAG: hypothetical protein WC663_05130 [Patescibacteria group bacterium]|jgi:hypothetical protein
MFFPKEEEGDEMDQQVGLCVGDLHRIIKTRKENIEQRDRILKEKEEAERLESVRLHEELKARSMHFLGDFFVKALDAILLRAARAGKMEVEMFGCGGLKTSLGYYFHTSSETEIGVFKETWKDVVVLRSGSCCVYLFGDGGYVSEDRFLFDISLPRFAGSTGYLFPGYPNEACYWTTLKCFMRSDASEAFRDLVNAKGLTLSKNFCTISW